MNLYVAIEQRPSLIEKLKEIPGLNVFCAPAPCPTEYRIEPKDAPNIEMLLCEFPPQNLDEFPSLRLIQISSTGYAQLYDRQLTERGIRACNGRGEFDIPIAEWAIAMMINLNRNLPQMMKNQQKAIWDRSACFQTELRGKTLGLFGYGSLARELARLAKALGMHIVAFDQARVDFTDKNYYMVPGTGDKRAEIPEAFYFPGEEKAFFSALDFLAIAMPLTKRTAGIVTEEYLRFLPKGAYVLNFARGPIIEEKGLLAVLQDGHLGGAALDAHYAYPLPPDHPLWNMENVILTPHISGSTYSTNFLPRIYDICAQNAVRLMKNEPLINELTADQLSGN